MNICIEISLINAVQKCLPIFTLPLKLKDKASKDVLIKSAMDPSDGREIFSNITAKSGMQHLEQFNYGKHQILRPRLKEKKTKPYDNNQDVSRCLS